MSEESNIKRVNISIDADLHHEVKQIFAEQSTNLSAEVTKYLSSLVQEQGNKPPTTTQLHNLYQAMGLDERVAKHMAESRESHSEWNPEEVFDEEAMHAKWVINIKRELAKETEEQS